MKDQTCYEEPSKLNQESQKNKPEISLLKGAKDAFKFTKTQIDERGAEEDNEDEYEFPHMEKDYTQTPAQSARVFA